MRLFIDAKHLSIKLVLMLRCGTQTTSTIGTLSSDKCQAFACIAIAKLENMKRAIKLFIRREKLSLIWQSELLRN